MVTGDQPRTGIKVAREVDLLDEEGDAPVVLGSGLEDVEDLSGGKVERIREASIFARVSHKQKLGVITIHQKAGIRESSISVVIVVWRIIRVSALASNTPPVPGQKEAVIRSTFRSWNQTVSTPTGRPVIES